MSRNTFSVLCILILIGAGVIYAENHVGIKLAKVSPRARSANMVLAVTIEESELNREIEVICESEDGHMVSSSKELEGSKNHRSQILFEFMLNSGENSCQAFLSRSDGKHPTSSMVLRFYVIR